MRIFFYKIVKFSFIFFVYFYSFALSIENKIILKINNQIITKLDIYQEANYLKALNPNINNLEEIKILEIAQSSLVREKIKEIELLKYNKNKINKEYLQEILQSIYTKIGLRNMNEFKQYIGTFGISIQIIEKKLKTEAHWNQLIYNKFYSKLKIDKKMIRENMKTTKRDTSTSYHLYEILFNLENDINSEDLFKNIEKSIHENGFENAASIYSISETSRTGGNLGWVNENNINDKKIPTAIAISM
jgi:peptidyl-prolyl cis-trans isomerase SurA